MAQRWRRTTPPWWQVRYNQISGAYINSSSCGCAFARKAHLEFKTVQPIKHVKKRRSGHLSSAAGLVLLNSAGQIQPDYTPPAGGGADVTAAVSPPPRLLVEVGRCARFALFGCVLTRCDDKQAACSAALRQAASQQILRLQPQGWCRPPVVRAFHCANLLVPKQLCVLTLSPFPQGLSRGRFLFLERPGFWTLARF